MTEVQAAPLETEVIPTELVAKTIAGISLIGEAHRALEEAGWTVTIAANRITVDGVIETQLISSNGVGWWQVYRVDGTPPVWTVGAQSDNSASSWLGAE
jgi:hypothetical protein